MSHVVVDNSHGLEQQVSVDFLYIVAPTSFFASSLGSILLAQFSNVRVSYFPVSRSVEEL